MQESTVKIGKEYFEKAKNDYSSWTWAWVREILQNAIDSKAQNIHINFNEDSVSVSDDGCGMTAEVIQNKLLTLGGSGKNFEDSVGGFGKAKELLYFCHENYTIHSLDNIVHGSGGNYTIDKTKERVGTISTVKLSFEIFENYSDIRTQFEKFISDCSYTGNIYIDGVLFTERLVVLNHIKTFLAGHLYETTNRANILIVRINEMPMFEMPIRSKDGFVFEVIGNSSDYVNSSRDSFLWRFMTEISEFSIKYSVDPIQALREVKPVVVRYLGKKGTIMSNLKKIKEFFEEVLVGGHDDEIYKAKNDIEKAIKFDTHKPFVIKAVEALTAIERGRPGIFDDAQIGTIEKIASLSTIYDETEYDFLVSNNTGKDIDDKWKQPSKFCKNAKFVSKAWQTVLSYYMGLFEREYMKIRFGFVFEYDILGTHKINEGFHEILINPLNNDGTNRYEMTKTGISQIISCATHEFCHALGYTYHNEYFAAKLHDMTSLVIEHSNEIIRLVRKETRGC